MRYKPVKLVHTHMLVPLHKRLRAHSRRQRAAGGRPRRPGQALRLRPRPLRRPRRPVLARALRRKRAGRRVRLFMVGGDSPANGRFVRACPCVRGCAGPDQGAAPPPLSRFARASEGKSVPTLASVSAGLSKYSCPVTQGPAQRGLHYCFGHHASPTLRPAHHPGRPSQVRALDGGGQPGLHGPGAAPRPAPRSQDRQLVRPSVGMR